MNDKSSHAVERSKQIRIWLPTAVALLFIITLFVLLLAAFRPKDEVASVTPTLTPTPTLSPSSTPELVTVEYQLELVEGGTAVSAQYWFTGGVEGNNRSGSRLISASRPLTWTVQVRPGDPVELSGVLANGRSGKLTGRILVEEVVIAQNARQGQGAGVYCSGVAIVN